MAQKRGIAEVAGPQPSEQSGVRKLLSREAKFDSSIDPPSLTTFDFVTHKPYGVNSVFPDPSSQKVSDAHSDLRVMHMTQNLLFATYNLMYTLVSRERVVHGHTVPNQPVARMYDVLFLSDVNRGTVAGGVTILRHEISPRERAILFGDDFEDPRQRSAVEVFFASLRLEDLTIGRKDTPEEKEIKMRKMVETRLKLLRLTPFELLRVLISGSTNMLTVLGVPLSLPWFALFFANRESWCSIARVYSCQPEPVSLISGDGLLYVGDLFCEFNALVLLFAQIKNKTVLCDKSSVPINTCVQFLNVLMNANTDHSVATLEKKLSLQINVHSQFLRYLYEEKKVDSFAYKMAASDLASTLGEIAVAKSQLKARLCRMDRKLFFYPKLDALIHLYTDSTFAKGDPVHMPRYMPATTNSSSFIQQERVEFRKRANDRFSELGCRDFRTNAKSLRVLEQTTMSLSRSAVQMLGDSFPGHDAAFVEELARYREEFMPLLFDQFDVPPSVASSTSFGLPAVDHWLLKMHKQGATPEQVMLNLAFFCSNAKEGTEERAINVVQGSPSAGKSVSIKSVCIRFLGEEKAFVGSSTQGSALNPSSTLFATKCFDEDATIFRVFHKDAKALWETRGDDSGLSSTAEASAIKSVTSGHNGRLAAAKVITEKNGQQIEQWRAQAQEAFQTTDVVSAVNPHYRLLDAAMMARSRCIPFPSSAVDFYKHFGYAEQAARASSALSAEDRKMFVAFSLASFFRSCGLADGQASSFTLAQLGQFLQLTAEPGPITSNWITAQINPRDTCDIERFMKQQTQSNFAAARTTIQRQRSYIDHFGANENMKLQEYVARMDSFLDEVATQMTFRLPLPSFARGKKNGPVIGTRDIMRILNGAYTMSFFSAFISLYYGNACGRSYTTPNPFMSSISKIPLVYQFEPEHVLKSARHVDLFDARTIDVARGLQMLIVQGCLQNTVGLDMNTKSFVLHGFFGGLAQGDKRIRHLNDMLIRHYPCSVKWSLTDIGVTLAHLSRVDTVEFSNSFSHPILDWMDVVGYDDERTDLHINFAVWFLPSYLTRLFDATFVSSSRPLYTLTFGIKTDKKGARSLEMACFDPRTYDRTSLNQTEHPLRHDSIDSLESIFETRHVSAPSEPEQELKQQDIMRTSLLRRLFSEEDEVIRLFLAAVSSQSQPFPPFRNNPQDALTKSQELFNEYVSLSTYPDHELVNALRTRLGEQSRSSNGIRDQLFSTYPSRRRDFSMDPRSGELVNERDFDPVGDEYKVPPCFSFEKRWLQDHLAEQAERGCTMYFKSGLRDHPLLLRSDYAHMEREYSIQKLCEQLEYDAAMESEIKCKYPPERHCLHPTNMSLSWCLDAKIRELVDMLDPLFSFAQCEVIDGNLYHSCRTGDVKCQPTKNFVKILVALLTTLFDYFFWKSTLHSLLSRVDEAFCLYEAERMGVRFCTSVVRFIPVVLSDPNVIDKKGEFTAFIQTWILRRLYTTEKARHEMLVNMSLAEKTDIMEKLNSRKFFNRLETLMFIPRTEDFLYTRQELQERFATMDDVAPLTVDRDIPQLESEFQYL